MCVNAPVFVSHRASMHSLWVSMHVCGKGLCVSQNVCMSVYMLMCVSACTCVCVCSCLRLSLCVLHTIGAQVGVCVCEWDSAVA